MSNILYDKKIKSTCSYYSVGCGVEITDLDNGKIHVEGDKDHPSSKGMLCSKAMNLHYTVNDTSDRLLYPEMRFNSKVLLAPITLIPILDFARRRPWWVTNSLWTKIPCLFVMMILN